MSLFLTFSRTIAKITNPERTSKRSAAEIGADNGFPPAPSRNRSLFPEPGHRHPPNGRTFPGNPPLSAERTLSAKPKITDATEDFIRGSGTLQPGLNTAWTRDYCGSPRGSGTQGPQVRSIPPCGAAKRRQRRTTAKMHRNESHPQPAKSDARTGGTPGGRRSNKFGSAPRLYYLCED